jgi:phage-related protein
VANTSSTIQIIFEGAVQGVRQAASQVEAAIRSVDATLRQHQAALDGFDRAGNRVSSVLGSMVKGFAGFGAAAASIQSVVVVAGTLATVTAELAPAALVLPGIFLGIGVAAGTAKLALSGFSDAVKGDAEALAKLAPAARESVGAIKGLEAGFTQLKRAVQQNFFAGLAPEIKATGTELLKLGKDHLPAVASGFNAMAKAALQAMRNPFFKDDLTIIIGNTATALGNMKNTLANVLSGFVGLGAVGSKYLPAIGKAIDDVAARFKSWVDSGVESGAIDRMIERALQGFRDLGATISNVFFASSSAIRAFNQGLSGGQGSTLESLRLASQALNEFANQPEIQSGLRALGETVRVVGDTFRTVFGEALRALGPILVELQPFIREMAEQIGIALVAAIRVVGPMLESLARFLSENKDAIGAIVPLLIPLAVGFKAVGLAIAAVRGFAAFSAGLTAIRVAIAAISATQLGAIAAAIARFLWPVAAFAGLALFAKYIDEVNIAAAGGDPAKLDGMAATLHNLVAAGQALLSGDFGAIFADIGAEWDLLVSKFQSGESPIGAVWKKISESFQRDFVDVIVNAGAAVIDFFTNLPTTIGAALASFGASIATFAQPVIDFFVNLPTTIGTALGDLGSFFVTKAQELWTAFLGGLQSFFAPVLAFFAQTPFQMGQQIGAGIGDFITAAINLWNAFLQGCQTGIAAVIAFCAALPGRIIAAIAGFIGMVAAWATNAWNGARNATVNVVNTVVSFCAQLPGRILSAINGFISMAINWARSAWEGVRQTTLSVVNTVLSFVGQIPGRIMSFLSSLPGQLRSNATTSWSSFQQGVVSVAGQVFSFVAGIPGRIISALGNLGSLLIGQGRAIIDGLLAGIRAGVQAMFDFVSGIAAGIRARKGPLSADKVLLIPEGMAIMDGLLRGLQAGESRLLNYAGTIAGRLSGALAEGVALPDLSPALATATNLGSSLNPAGAGALAPTATELAGALSATPTPITNVTVKIGETELRQIVETVIENVNREVARVVGTGRGRG